MDIISANLELGLFFLLGMLCQFFCLIGGWNAFRNRKLRKRILTALLFSLIAFFPFEKGEQTYNVTLHFVMFICFNSIGLPWAFRKEILPTINERIVFQSTIILWSFMWPLVHYAINENHPYFLIFLVLLLVPSIATIYSAITKKKFSKTVKFCFYLWFLVVTLLLTLPNLIFVISVAKQLWNGQTSHLGELEVFLAGAVFFYFMGNFIYVLALIPLPGKHQSFDSRLKQVRQFANLLIEKYDDVQMDGLEVLFMVLVQICLVFIILRYGFAGLITTINLSMIFMQIVGSPLWVRIFKHKIENPLSSKSHAQS